MALDIRKDGVFSEYSVELALVSRNNPDGTMPFAKSFTLPYENADGSIEERKISGGVLGKLGNTDIRKINAGAGEALVFIELGKTDTVEVDLSGVVNPESATLANIATALNATIESSANFPNIGHGFHARLRGNRIQISADIPLTVTGIPEFVNGEYEFGSTSLSVSIKEGGLTADDVTVTTTNGVMGIEDFLDALQTALGATTFTNAGHGYKAYIDDGQIAIVADIDVPEIAPLAIKCPVDSDTGLVTSLVAKVLEFDKPYWRAVRHMKSLSASNNITDAETIENTDGKGTVTTVTTEQSSTGVTVALEDMERNPITSVCLTGGYLDPSTGKFTQKKSGVSAPEIGLLVFSKTFGAGNFGIGGNEGISMTIYPSNTAIKNNMDKGEGEFNNDTYDITASDGREIEINSGIYWDKDESDLYRAFADLV